jgi:organic hydroperoxide reductase OsmC/OhrA
MMGTLAAALAGKEIPTLEDLYWAAVEGDIERVNDIPKITQIRVTYHLKVSEAKASDAREAFSAYLTRCPAAQSVMGCIEIRDELVMHATDSAQQRS